MRVGKLAFSFGRELLVGRLPTSFKNATRRFYARASISTTEPEVKQLKKLMKTDASNIPFVCLEDFLSQVAPDTLLQDRVGVYGVRGLRSYRLE